MARVLPAPLYRIVFVVGVLTALLHACAGDAEGTIRIGAGLFSLVALLDAQRLRVMGRLSHGALLERLVLAGAGVLVCVLLA